MEIREETWEVEGVEYPCQIVEVGGTVSVFVDGEIVETWNV